MLIVAAGCQTFCKVQNHGKVHLDDWVVLYGLKMAFPGIFSSTFTKKKIALLKFEPLVSEAVWPEKNCQMSIKVA